MAIKVLNKATITALLQEGNKMEYQRIEGKAYIIDRERNIIGAVRFSTYEKVQDELKLVAVSGASFCDTYILEVEVTATEEIEIEVVNNVAVLTVGEEIYRYNYWFFAEEQTIEEYKAEVVRKFKSDFENGFHYSFTLVTTDNLLTNDCEIQAEELKIKMNNITLEGSKEVWHIVDYSHLELKNYIFLIENEHKTIQTIVNENMEVLFENVENGLNHYYENQL